MGRKPSESSKKQLNLRVKQTTIDFLLDKAKSYELVYDKKASVSKLLDEIGDGKLVISHKRATTRKIGGSNYTVSFQFLVKDCPGCLASVTQIFSDKEIPIVGVKTFSPEANGRIDIIARIPKSYDPVIILELADKLTLNDIWSYAEAHIYNTIRKKGEEVSTQIISSYKAQKVVIDSNFCVSLQVHAAARIGLAADLTKIIAEEKINLLSIFREFDEESVSITDFYLQLTKFEQMEILIKRIKEEIDAVEDVYQTDVNEILKVSRYFD